MSLAIANEWGNVDLAHNRLHGAYAHVPGKRLQPLCRKLGIKFASAVVGFDSNKYGCKPVTDGVVVSKRSAAKLLEAIAERDAPEKIAKRAAAKEIRDKKRQESDAWWTAWWTAQFKGLGIDPDSVTAQMYRAGEIDEEEARLMSFKARYRHEFTDYDGVWEEFGELNGNTYEDRRGELEERREFARETKVEQEIPDNWPDYLKKYGFAGETAEAMAQVLKDPKQCHPVWFRACMIGLEGEDLAGLTYERIRFAKIDLHRED